MFIKKIIIPVLFIFVSVIMTLQVFAEPNLKSGSEIKSVNIVPWHIDNKIIFKYEKPLQAHRKEWQDSAIAEDLIDLNLVSLPELYSESESKTHYPIQEILGWKDLTSSYNILIDEKRNAWTYLGYNPISLEKSKNFELKVYPPYRRWGSSIKKYERSSMLPLVILPKVSSRVSKIIANRINKIQDNKEDVNFWRSIAEGNQTIILSEGFKKSLSILSIGLVSVSIPGACQGYRISKEDGVWKAQVVPELEPFLKQKRKFILVFDKDKDRSLHRLVLSSALILGKLLRERGFAVSFIDLPEDTKGADDYIYKYGQKSFKSLVKNSIDYLRYQQANHISMTLEEISLNKWCIKPCEGTCGFYKKSKL
jgi:hypothetical protein